MLTKDLEMTAAPREDAARTQRLLDFERLYEAHAPFVWRTARGLGVSLADCDDAVQEVFVVAYRKLPDFAGRSSLRTWLCGIALGVVRNHKRKLQRREATNEALPRPAVSMPGEGAEALDLVTRCLDDLSEPLRLVFVLAELEHLTAPEIAEVLTMNLNTVYSRIRQARELFEASVARHGGGR